MNLVLSLVWLLSALGSKEIPLAAVVRVHGHAQAGPANALVPIKSGDVVSKNWQIKTEADGKVLLRFLADKTLVDIKPSSLVELDVRTSPESGSVPDLAVLGGGVAIFVPKGSAGTRAQTENTVTTAQSGQFGMSTGTDGQARVDVLNGKVQVCNQTTGDHQTLTTGQSQVSGYEGLADIKPVSPDSSMAKMEVNLPQIDPSSTTTQIEVPFLDPVSGKASTLVIGVKRGH